MGILRDRLEPGLLELTSSSGGRAVSEIIARLESGESLAAKTDGLAAVDLIAALAAAALGDQSSLGPALTQEKPRHPKLARALSEPALAAMFPSVPHPLRLTLAAGLLQVHDFWDASHEAAQQADDRGERGTSAYWHGIAHRREPDASNAAYWFRRVGRHPVFVPLAQAARPLFDLEGLAPLEEQLMPGGAWNASAMTELCTTAKSGTPRERLARRIQRMEMWLLLEASFEALK
jgi:hypothetical protein